jgi:glycosyltransferase involved in cell wall biosynthesis
MGKRAIEMKTPKVSIGLAVYNGETFLDEAIESILRQTFTDFELIISDNASTDRTAEICQRYVERDPRVRYYRNDTNIGGANNENLTFRLARGQYFRWAAHDDVCDAELLAKCVEVLDTNPAVVLCSTMTVKIDEHGNPIGLLDRNKAISADPHVRLRELASMDHWCEESYGLMRTAVLQKTDLQLNYTDSDRTLLSELSLYGRFYQVPEKLFYKRIHAAMSTSMYPKWRARMAWFNPAFVLAENISCPNWLQFFHYLAIIRRAPLTRDERMHCYQYILGRWLFIERHGRSMVSDLVLAGARMPRFLFSRIRNAIRQWRPQTLPTLFEGGQRQSSRSEIKGESQIDPSLQSPKMGRT